MTSISPPNGADVRVLYVLKRYPQLSQTFVVREILELERAGVHVGIEALGSSRDGPRHPDVAVVTAVVRHLPRRPRLRQHRIGSTHARLALRRPLIWLRLARKARHRDWRRFVQAGLVAKRIRQEGFHHVHAHFASSASEVARDAAALAGCTYSVTAHARDIFTEQHARLLAERLADAYAVVTVSEHNRRHLETVVAGPPIVHVPNAMPAEPARRPIGGGPVLCVARLVDKKGIDTLIRAIAIVRRINPEVTVEIIGDGDDGESLRALSRSLGLDDVVTFLGALDSTGVNAAYLRCSMLALPCRISIDGDRDGLPTVILEAMARSIPVISTSIVGIPEVVTDGITGRLVEPGDSCALAAAILDLLDHPEAAARLGAAGRRIVVADFDPDQSAARLKSLFAHAGGTVHAFRHTIAPGAGRDANPG